MTSWDYFVGFEREPKDLGEFLDSHGYVLSEDQPEKPKNVSDRNYESREGGLVDLFYHHDVSEVEEGECPDWARQGFKVTSELMISTKEGSAAEEALRLAEATIKRYNGILYDSISDEYLGREEL